MSADNQQERLEKSLKGNISVKIYESYVWRT